MSTAKIVSFFLLLVIIFGLPAGAEAMKPCSELWSPGKVYGKYTMKRCDLEFRKLTYDAIASYPPDLWK